MQNKTSMVPITIDTKTAASSLSHQSLASAWPTNIKSLLRQALGKPEDVIKWLASYHALKDDQQTSIAVQTELIYSLFTFFFLLDMTS